MNTYNPQIKIYYGDISSSNRILPGPEISIGLNYDYSNDAIIGYKYTITLNGLLTGLDLRNLPNNSPIPNDSSNGFPAVISHIQKLRNILSQNGSSLQVVDSSDNVILKAKGGILRSLNFDESTNNWTQYAAYTATIDFHSIDFGDYEDSCSSFLDPSTFPDDGGGIVDVNKYKIKTFEDNWTFSFDDNESYNKMFIIDNRSFNIEYTISATGKHFYNDDGLLIPAWEQAKNFVQYRLYQQVKNLLKGVLKNTYTNACSSNDDLQHINIPGSSQDGLLKDLSDAFAVYDEKVSCSTSETEGSFSATYTAICKSKWGNLLYSDSFTKHNISKTIATTTEGNRTITTVTLNGTIEGLIPGGLTNGNGPISLPKEGSFFVSGGSPDKHSQALSTLNKIFNPEDYNGGLGGEGKVDLKPSFKNIMGITGGAGPNNTIPDPPHPVSFNLTHDYNAGTINYNVQYSSNAACGRKYQEISIQKNNPVPIIATIDIPNGIPIFQNIGNTLQTTSITIKGLSSSDTNDIVSINDIISSAPLSDAGVDNGILTSKQYTVNPITGSYTISLTFICGTSC